MAELSQEVMDAYRQGFADALRSLGIDPPESESGDKD